MWRSEWSALSRRILGLLEAAKFHISYIAERPDVGVGVKLVSVTSAIFEDLRAFQDRYARTLPAGAATVLTDFIETSFPRFRSVPTLDGDGNRQLHSRLTDLVALEAEISYHLTDFTARAKRLSERAFTHLQRSIVADPDCAKRWRQAFDKGERACEQLGAAHLLWHGIWAFKGHSKGERTDLIMGDVIRNYSEIEKVAEALVLTEWKKVTKKDELSKSIDQALGQAKLYAGGSLAGLELDTYRYLVLVTERALEMPDDIDEPGVKYRPINIAVEPESPSRAARQHG